MILPTARFGPERVKPGLDRIRLAFERSGHPEESFRTIHIAGTNGKGSTAWMTEAIIRPLAGRAVGLYTSPHLVSPEERIRIDGAKISRRSLTRAFLKAEALGDPDDPPTYFEKMTWAACDWFRRGKARLVVMETGLGGRWDATTACHTAVSVITTVGYDHMEWLGSTLGRIAEEKAGILKPGVPLVTGRLRPSARMVVMRRARELGCFSWELGREFDWRPCRRGAAIDVFLPGLRLKGLRVAMNGIFQRDNAAVALAASWMWASGEGISAASFTKAAVNAVASVRVPGRLARLSLRGNARCWVDGGHNPEAARALAETIAVSRPWGRASRVVALWSMLSDKDASGYLRELSPCIDAVVTYPLSHERAADAAVLCGTCEKAALPYRAAAGFSEGFLEAVKWAGRGGVVLVCGSFAAAGDAYERLVGSVS